MRVVSVMSSEYATSVDQGYDQEPEMASHSEYYSLLLQLS